MISWSKVFVIPWVFLLIVLLSKILLAGQEVPGKPTKAEVMQKTMKLRMPFIANKGQVDERVAFYAKTFGGTVFVTKDGEIVYSLPTSEKAEDGSHNVCRDEPNPRRDTEHRVPTTHSTSIALREEFVGAKVSGVKGEGASVTKVSYFKGNDPSKWKSNISTYELVNLGEIYEGIELKLRAHGNNVEKLLYVKPGADPNQIKISLSGIQPSENPSPFIPSLMGTVGCPPLAGAGGGLETEDGLVAKGGLVARGLSVNEHGELEAETALGTVRFTKPIAYQEIDGKRVEVDCKYVIRDCGEKDTPLNPLLLAHPYPHLFNLSFIAKLSYHLSLGVNYSFFLFFSL